MVTITDITDGTIGGAGYFDKIMTALNAQIDFQFSKQRLQGKDFATVYLGALQAALSSAIQYVGIVEQVAASIARTTSETALLDQKTKTEMAQILDTINSVPVAGAVGQQIALQGAQSSAFARSAEQKAVKILLDAWAINKSVVGSDYPAPEGALNDDISDMITVLRTGIGITESIYGGVADAGPDQTVATGAFVQLTSAGSTDRVDGSDVPQPPSGFIWTQLSGTVMTLTPIVDVETTEEVITFTAPGSAEVLVFKVEAKYADSDPVTSDYDTVTIIVE